MVPIRQIPGVYHRRIGDIVVTAISDGYVDVAYEMMRQITPQDAEILLRAAFRPAPPRLSVNCFLIHSAGRVALVDTGAGGSMNAPLGRTMRHIEAAGVALADIDTVMLTHMHPDHSNGLTTPEGKANFPNAELVVSETDVKHWHDDSAMSIANERHRERFFMGARAQIRPYLDRRRDSAGEVFPGVSAVPLPGHTPGHTGYMVNSGDQTLMIWGDIFHIPDIQVPRPQVHVEQDSDHEMAVATRRRTFEMTARERMLVAGSHMHFPGFLYMTGDASNGYQVQPEMWMQDL